MTGTLLTLAPRSLELPLLLRAALDAEQVGATRIHLAADQVGPVDAVAALRAHTGLLITADRGGPFDDLADLLSQGQDVTNGGRTVLREVDPDRALDDADLVADVAGVIRTSTVPVSVICLGTGAMPALLAALGAGGHVRVGSHGDVEAGTRADTALVARAAGIARLVGRPAMSAAAVRAMLGADG